MCPSELWILDDARIMGGGQLFDLRLARYVHAQRGAASVRLVCPGSSELAGRARAAAIPVTPMEFPAPAALPRIVAQAVVLRRALRGHDALVVAGTARCQAVAVVAGLGPRLVHLMTERDSADRASVRLVQRHTGRVVALGAQAAAAYGSAALSNFLLDEEFARLAAAPPPPGDGSLGVLARLIPEKGVLELIGELGGVGGWRRLLVAGASQDADYAARVRAAADGRVQFVGEVDHPADLIGQVDVLIVPSTGYEGQPTVIVEALAAGRPVIVREPIYSPDYDGLPVFAYGDLAQALRAAARAAPVDPDLVRGRFGAAHALAVIEGSPA